MSDDATTAIEAALTVLGWGIQISPDGRGGFIIRLADEPGSDTAASRRSW